MLKTLFSIGLMTMVGIFALKLVFGLFGAFVGLMFVLIGWALKILIIGALIYLVIRIISPSTARRMTDSVSGSPEV